MHLLLKVVNLSQISGIPVEYCQVVGTTVCILYLD